MWIFTLEGFFSVVTDQATPGNVLVRSREKRHLENLLKVRPWLLERVRIQTLKAADYRFRVSMPKGIWSAVLGELTTEVTYGNFKAAALHSKRAKLSDTYINTLFDVYHVVEDNVKGAKTKGKRR